MTSTAVPFPPPLPFLPIEIYIQPQNTTAVELRIPCSADPGSSFAPLYRLAQDALGHLAHSSEARNAMMDILRSGRRYSDVAKEAFETKFPTHSTVAEDLIVEYLTVKPPKIILVDMPHIHGEDRKWVYVLKAGCADPALAERNEVFVSRELTDALLEENPIVSDTDAETSVKRARIQLLWKTALIHGIQHSIAKFMFSPAYIASIFATPIAPDGRGNGEHGDDFELAYITFLVQAERASKADASLAGSRSLWSIQRLLADQAGKTYELGVHHLSEYIGEADPERVCWNLDDVQVRALVSAMNPTTRTVPQFDFAETPVAVLAPGSVCYRRVTHTESQAPVSFGRMRHAGPPGVRY
ncbi:hypothetical protein C8R46DRAFT_1304162 [Mycena filopes]|nr:hypothetical protein C8R46DRAFT_1304162 [Mycena filopes]